MSKMPTTKRCATATPPAPQRCCATSSMVSPPQRRSPRVGACVGCWWVSPSLLWPSQRGGWSLGHRVSVCPATPSRVAPRPIARPCYSARRGHCLAQTRPGLRSAISACSASTPITPRRTPTPVGCWPYLHRTKVRAILRQRSRLPRKISNGLSRSTPRSPIRAAFWR